jgi:hypothetical protein
MKTTKKTLFFFLLFLATFLNSCNQKKTIYFDDPNNSLHFSPMEQILKMHPVKITIANWIEYERGPKLKLETEEEAKAAFNNPENWIVKLEITNVNEINNLMTALKKTPIEKAIGMPTNETKICFFDKNGNYKSTIFALDRADNKLYIWDKVYGEETYKVFANILKTKPQETNQPSQKRSE